MLHTRLDRNFINHHRNIDGYTHSEPDQLLVRRLFGFISFAFQYSHPILDEDLFGNKILDPKVFSDFFCLSKKHLNSPHPSPIAFQDLSQPEIEQILSSDENAGKGISGGEPAWYSNLDNALYYLYKSNINFTELSTRTAKDGNQEALSELKTASIFQTLRKVYVNKTRKVYYEYKEHPAFVENNAKYFLYFDFSLFRKLTLVEMRVYLSLLKIRAQERYQVKLLLKGIPQVVDNPSQDLISHGEVKATKYDINYLVDLWNIHLEDGKEGKSKFSREKSRINKLINSINEKAGYTFCEITWSKKYHTSKTPGQPVLTFPLPDSEREYNRKEQKNRIEQFSIHCLKEHFRTLSQGQMVSVEDFKKGFINYLINSNFDHEGKRAACTKALRMVLSDPNAILGDNFMKAITSNFVSPVSNSNQLESMTALIE